MIRIISLLSLALLVGVGAAQAAQYSQFSSRADFDAALGKTVNDSYDAPGYTSLGLAPVSDDQVSAVLNETDYKSTIPSNQNFVGGKYYCAGCNGSFLLSFGNTSVTEGLGVFGVGLRYYNGVSNSLTPLYSAFVTFGDLSTKSFSLKAVNQGVFNGFFGITSDQKIVSIHFGLGDEVKGATSAGAFGIDDLTIGKAAEVEAVPLPASLLLLLAGLGSLALGQARRRA